MPSFVSGPRTSALPLPQLRTIIFAVCFLFLAPSPALSLLRSLSLGHPTRPRLPSLAPSFHPPARILAQNTNASSSCPVDYSYVKELPWAPTLCQSQLYGDKTQCCVALFNTFGVGLSLYLKNTGNFELPDNATVFACLDAYHSELQAEGLTENLVGECFQNPSMFIRSPLLCSGIETKDDWQRKMGSTSMDTSCRGDLTDKAVCQICTSDASIAYSKIAHTSINNSSCFYFVVIYAAGIINSYGPTNASTAACLLAVQPPSTNSGSGSSKRRLIVIYISVGVGIVLLIGCISAILFWVWIRRKRQMVHLEFVERNSEMLKGSLMPNTGAVWYNYEDVKSATNNFSPSNIIGIGGFATVYKGVMPDGLEVAVKQIKNCTPEGDAEFLNEFEVIKNIRHRNLVVLRGCCVASNTNDGHQRLLVYDYMSNGSLEDYLFGGKRPPLTWAERRKIAVDTAKGITYLHNGLQSSIIHRDVKANNILLDERLNAKVADFGLARITEEGMTHLTTRVAGTQGYLAPEYALYGQLTEKSDVYSFGVLLLVLLSGRKALGATLEWPSHYLITDWAWMMVKEGNVKDIIDKSIREDGPEEIMVRFVLVGILCAHLLVAFRPTIAQALRMLEGDIEIPQIPDRPLPLNCDSVSNSEGTYSFSCSSGAPSSYNLTDMLL